jgi:hypothetical protein
LPRAEFPCAGLFASDHLLEWFAYLGFVHQLNASAYVRIRTEFGLVKRSKWRKNTRSQVVGA